MSACAQDIGAVARMAELFGDRCLSPACWHDVARILSTSASVLELAGASVDQLVEHIGRLGQSLHEEGQSE